ncbi:MAG TPA: galactokinase family protein [Capillimicrobium sp.]|nr:galactokinase family protein [Capillimicrobium sp.]
MSDTPVVAFAPGRVNLIGEHTDYNGGLALPFAIAAGVTVTATPADGHAIEAVARDLGEQDRFPVDDPAPAQVSGWRAFVRGTVHELRAAGHAPRPARIEIAGDVPRGAGLSSSAALEVALCLALLGPDAQPAGDAERVDLARLCSRVENDHVGARTGLLDQLAALLGRPEHALRIDFATLTVEPVPLHTGGWRLVTLDSGERHAHAAGGYNERRRECAAICERLGIASVSDAAPDDLRRLPEPLHRRARHVLEENARVDAAVAALRDGDLPALGRLLDASHASLRDLYDASTEAVEHAVRRLRDAGAAGARMVGGGFGGHVLALLPPDVDPPDGALVVEPGPGAQLTHRDQ